MRRETNIPSRLPLAYTDEYALDESKQIQWKAFLRKSNLENIAFELAIDELQRFIGPLFADDQELSTWTPETYWR